MARGGGAACGALLNCFRAWLGAVATYCSTTRWALTAAFSHSPSPPQVANCGIVDLILSFASFKADKELKKGDGAKRQRLTGGSGCAVSSCRVGMAS